jgi:hypothetical protein
MSSAFRSALTGRVPGSGPRWPPGNADPCGPALETPTGKPCPGRGAPTHRLGRTSTSGPRTGLSRGRHAGPSTLRWSHFVECVLPGNGSSCWPLPSLWRWLDSPWPCRQRRVRAPRIACCVRPRLTRVPGRPRRRSRSRSSTRTRTTARTTGSSPGSTARSIRCRQPGRWTSSTARNSCTRRRWPPGRMRTASAPGWTTTRARRSPQHRRR